MLKLPIILYFLLTAIAAQADDISNPILQKLDSVVALSDQFDVEKLRRIDGLRQRALATASDDERYVVNNLLYEEFKTFNVDSAMTYANANAEIAARGGNPQEIARQAINRSFVMAASGLLTEALDAIKDVDPLKLDREQKIDYYGQMMYLYSHLGNFSQSSSTDIAERYYALERECKDSLASIVIPSDPGYLWFRGWRYLGTDGPVVDQLIDSLTVAVDSSDGVSRHDAMNAYILARLLEEEGCEDEYVEYMSRSAMSDVISSNRDIASIEELAKYLFKKGDLDRAHAYINYALQASLKYPNKVRTGGMVGPFDEITKAFRERGERQSERVSRYMLLLGVMSIILLATVVIIISQTRRLRVRNRSLAEANCQLNSHIDEVRTSHEQLDRANSQLNELNRRLSESNAELIESNFLKEEYLGYAFAICSKFIKKGEDFRRAVSRKCKARQYDDIQQMADSAGTAKDDMKEFYQNFDSTFLKIYPDFVEDFNALLQPDERIVPKEGELLNTELRIYALVRLGITDSVKIAEFLHCSPQTVYNNRFRVRGKAVIAKEDFAETVQSLGKGKITPPKSLS